MTTTGFGTVGFHGMLELPSDDRDFERQQGETMRATKHIRAAALAFATCGVVANAQALSFTYTGVVTQTSGFLSGVTVGMLFQGSFSYDPSTHFVEGADSFARYEFAPAGSFTTTIAGHEITGDNFGINVYNGVVANGYPDGYQISDHHGLLVDGTRYFLGYFDLSLRGDANLLSSSALPTSLDITSFASYPASFGALNLGQGGNALTFSISGITPISPPVPEPETWAGLLAGLALLGAFVKRRRGASATPA